MIQGEGIEELVELLEQRGVCLYHACQLVDFQSYLNLEGIPSRAHLENRGQSYTRFETDEKDRTRGVWDKVFANLSDFGFFFARGYKAVPNPFGPILFQIKPEALYDTTDVAICLRSAGRPGFDRERESLTSIQDVDCLFQYPVEDSRRARVKTSQELQRDFTPQASAPEISCTIVSGKLPMHYVQWVRVEPFIIGGQPLRVRVEQLKLDSGERFRVFERDRADHYPPYINELIDILVKEIPSLQNLSQGTNVSQELRDWAKGVMDNNIEYQFNRFAKYLRDGTILPILQGQF